MEVLERAEQERVVRVEYEDLDVSTVPAVERQLVQVADCGATVLTVDLSGVRVLDSAGIGLLVRAYKALHRQGRELRVQGATGTVQRSLDITGLDRFLTINGLPPRGMDLSAHPGRESRETETERLPLVPYSIDPLKPEWTVVTTPQTGDPIELPNVRLHEGVVQLILGMQNALGRGEAIVAELIRAGETVCRVETFPD